MEAIMGCYLIPVTGEVYGVVDPQRGSCSRGGNALICSPWRSERRVDNEMNPRYNTQWLQSDMEIWLIFIYCRDEERQTYQSLDYSFTAPSHHIFCQSTGQEAVLLTLILNAWGLFKLMRNY